VSVGSARAELSSFLGRRLYAAPLKNAAFFVRLVVVRLSTCSTRLVSVSTKLRLLLLLLLLEQQVNGSEEERHNLQSF